MKDIKIGAVKHPEKDVVAIVFEFSQESFDRMAELAMWSNKQIFSNIFTQHVSPKKVLRAMTIGVKALRRELK